ncbi:hypothetical protein HGA91_01275 [candidate division WWE3 bacterium]|nr:hypothetical protein [candidate division WWE3 bacterium]
MNKQTVFSSLTRLLFLFLITLLCIVRPVSISHAGGIFDGSGNNSGIFSGFRDRLDSIFDGFFGAFPGGAVIQGPANVPSDAPVPTGEVPPGVPPAPNMIKQVKLSLEWDTVSLGGEAFVPTVEDPLKELHESLISCPQCGPGRVRSGIQEQNSPLASTELNTPTSLNGLIGETANAFTVPTPTDEPPHWEICPESGCHVSGIRHVIAGWCGQSPVMADWGAVPVTSHAAQGPNTFGLANSISNKFIRRDGYSYKCVRDCFTGSCEDEAYVEFHTEVYASNAISLYVKAENTSDLEIDNILVRLNTKTFDARGEDAFAHNVDFLVARGGATDNPLNPVNYIHGSSLDEYLTEQIGLYGSANPDWPSILIRTINGVPMYLETRPDVTSPQIVFGPFTLQAGEIKELPLQPSSSEITVLPDTTDSITSSQTLGEYKLSQPAVPCQCQGVKLHGGEWGCQYRPDHQPTIQECAQYYGITIADQTHAGGFTCDQGGYTVPGCPPPWCYERAQSEGRGSLSQCPDLNGDGEGDLIPYADCSGPTCEVKAPEDKNSDIMSWLEDRMIIPAPIKRLFQTVNPPAASAMGCFTPCIDIAPPSISGLGGLVPRDYNFVCDKYDQLSGNRTEDGRCLGTDPRVLILPKKPDTTPNPLFYLYRDVTAFGGCGYNASSNNSVIGPIEVSAEFGGLEEDRASRSVILASIPIGGRLSDDQARPYGWPVSGQISQEWGYTGEADSQGPYRGNPSQDYGEYRYCKN